jgi:branched-chain amino acid transport system substrate-binding protein
VATQLCLTVALILGAGGCGKNSGSGETGSVGTVLTVYSSMPLQGPNAAAAQAIVDGEKLALAQAGGRVGELTVKYVSLDDSTAESKGWDARQSAKNARTAVQDRTAIAYLGDFDAGATAITLPTLNEASLLQVTPATTLVGLTRAEGADKGEPDKYYPTGTRTFGRVIQADDVQANAQIAEQQMRGCQSTYLLHDMEAYGKSLTDLIALFGPRQGLKVTDGQGIDTGADDYSGQVDKISGSGADCLFFGGNAADAAVRLLAAVHAALPRLQLFVPSGLATPAFAAALGPALEKVTHLTSPGLAPRLYPAKGRAFLRRYQREHGGGESAAIAAMYGYEAMGVALQAIRMAGAKGNDKRSVVEEFFKIRGRRSVLGRYSIDPGGDTTLTGYAAYRVAGGKLVFERLLGPRPT